MIHLQEPLLYGKYIAQYIAVISALTIDTTQLFKYYHVRGRMCLFLNPSAIVFRTLGSCANVVAERKNVHHSIINGMDSHASFELDAAIFAAEKVAAKSK